MDTKGIVKRFVKENFLKGNTTVTLLDDSSFIESGIIDSLGVLELTVFLEETFGFRVEDEEIVPENLDSISKLINYISSKLSGVEVQQLLSD